MAVEWTYVRRGPDGNGQLVLNGVVVGTGYSGHGIGLNNPEAERDIGVGPIPAGRWIAGTFFDHPHLGPCVSRLIPSSYPKTETYGRTGFFVHGDNSQGNHSASDGCIILAHDLREKIRDSGLNVAIIVI